MRKKILFDMDNVLADQVGGFLATLEKDFPHIPRPNRADLTEFDFEKHFEEEFRDTILNIRLSEGFFRTLPEMPGMMVALQKIALEHDVWIVTAPTWEWKYCVPEKYAWIEEHLGREWVARLLITRDKTLVRGDFLIDDAPQVVGVLEPLWEHVLFDQPYNRAVVGKRRVSADTLHTIV